MGPELQRLAGGRLPPLDVGRAAERNVVITPLRELGDGRVRAGLVVDPGHSSFFDHELDHVPGMLLVEAARQATIAGIASRHGIDPREIHLVAVRGNFSSFGELDVPITCDATIGPLAGRGVETNVELHHPGRGVGAIVTRVALARPAAVAFTEASAAA